MDWQCLVQTGLGWHRLCWPMAHKNLNCHNHSPMVLFAAELFPHYAKAHARLSNVDWQGLSRFASMVKRFKV